MNETESKALPTPQTNTPQSQTDCLQRQITFLFVAVLIVSGTFCAAMGLQARRARGELGNLKPVAVQVIQAAEKDKAQWEDFVKKVTEFGKAHPSFDPIMKKYRLGVTATNAPVPAQPAKPK